MNSSRLRYVGWTLVFGFCLGASLLIGNVGAQQSWVDEHNGPLNFYKTRYPGGNWEPYSQGLAIVKDLQTLATIGRNHLREVDTLARSAGEEFALLLPQTGYPEALSVAERLRQAIADAVIEYESRRVHLTLSLGVATLDVDRVQRIEQLMQLADAALYRAKTNGRNRVEAAVLAG